jgi:hypothetical protein
VFERRGFSRARRMEVIDFEKEIQFYSIAFCQGHRYNACERLSYIDFCCVLSDDTVLTAAGRVVNSKGEDSDLNFTDCHNRNLEEVVWFRCRLRYDIQCWRN